MAKDIMSELVGAIGKNDDEATVKHWLDSGFPPLNNASSSDWNDAFPVGRLIEIAGPPSAGKTAIATQAMVAAQKAGGIAIFMDHERSFSFKLAERIGLNTKAGFVYKKPETFEESVAIFHLAVKTIREKKLIDKNAPICAVFDSLAAMTPQSILYDSKGKPRSAEDRNMNDNTALSRATSAHFPSISQIAEKYDVCVIFLNQMRTKIGVMFGDPRKTTGGDSPEFYFSQRLWLSASQIKKGTEIIGMEVTGSYKKNKVNRPFKTAKWRFMFQEDGTGRFDRERSLIEFLEELGQLEKGNKAGNVVFDGKEINKEHLARQLETEGDKGFKKLTDLLPPAYSPPIVAEADLDVGDGSEDDQPAQKAA